MNLDQLRQKLLAAARTNPPGGHVPYAFEKGVMARLVAGPAFDLSELWARAFWRAAAPCVAVAVLLIVWSFVANDNQNISNGIAENEDFSQHFEQTMLVTVNEAEDIW
jgi:hypothetical protein